MVSIFRHGINKDNIGPIAKASFEETTEMFLQAARHGELDEMRGVSANIMCGQEGYYGTSSFSTYLDNDKMYDLYKERDYNMDAQDDEESYVDVENMMKDLETNKEETEYCSIQHLKKANTIGENIVLEEVKIVEEDDYEMGI